MKSIYFFLMGIIFLTINAQAMNEKTNENKKATTPFLERLAKANDEWKKRQNKQKIYDTFEVEEMKKLQGK